MQTLSDETLRSGQCEEQVMTPLQQRLPEASRKPIQKQTKSPFVGLPSFTET